METANSALPFQILHAMRQLPHGIVFQLGWLTQASKAKEGCYVKEGEIRMETVDAPWNLNGRLSQPHIGRSAKGSDFSRMKACVNELGKEPNK